MKKKTWNPNILTLDTTIFFSFFKNTNIQELNRILEYSPKLCNLISECVRLGSVSTPPPLTIISWLVDAKNNLKDHH